jgi:hypothetical protein
VENHFSHRLNPCIVDVLTNGPNEKRISLRSVLKEIHEWIAAIGRFDPSPTFVDLWGPYQIVRKVIFGLIWCATMPRAACRGGPGWSRTYSEVRNFACPTAAAIYS